MRFEIDPHWLYVDIPEAEAKKLDAVWNAKRKAWKLPNTLGALRELYKLYPLPEIAEYGKKKAKQRKALLELKNYNMVDYGLRPYQNDDLHFLRHLDSAGVFLEQRLGKSPLAIRLFEEEGRKKNIVVCPASLTVNWSNEVTKWSDKTPHIIKGTKTKRLKLYDELRHKNEGYWIISKDTLKQDIGHLEAFSFDGMIVDEAHYLNGYKTLQSKATYRLGRKSHKKLALTGTPARSKGDGVYGILHFLHPERFPSYWQFVERYFNLWQSPWGSREVGKYKRKAELQEILDVISVQRKRKDVFQWLPPKQYQTIEVEMDAKQQKAYKEMLDTFIVEDEGEVKVDAPSVLAQLTRLRQICLSPGLLDINAPSAKEQFILEWLEDNPDETVIIFSNFTSYLKELAKKVKGSVMIHGEMTTEQKQQSVDAIQSGKSKVLLANIISAGVGFTLDKAETAIFLDRDFTPTNNEQAEDRLIPVSEERNHSCTIIDIVIKDTVDSKLTKLLAQKKSIIEVINDYKNVKELIGK